MEADLILRNHPAKLKITKLEHLIDNLRDLGNRGDCVGLTL